MERKKLENSRCYSPSKTTADARLVLFEKYHCNRPSPTKHPSIDLPPRPHQATNLSISRKRHRSPSKPRPITERRDTKQDKDIIDIKQRPPERFDSDIYESTKPALKLSCQPPQPRPQPRPRPGLFPKLIYYKSPDDQSHQLRPRCSLSHIGDPIYEYGDACREGRKVCLLACLPTYLPGLMASHFL